LKKEAKNFYFSAALERFQPDWNDQKVLKTL